MNDKNIPQNNNIGNLTIDDEEKIIKADFYHLPFYKKNFFEASDFVKFIKSVEKFVRSSDAYKTYINYLKSDIGLNHCMIQPNINDELVDGGGKLNSIIEMHHGPILTLFDYCTIIANSYLQKGEGINTFMIAKEVLDEHFANRVQVVMLSQTTHQLVHAGRVFIHPDQAWGDLNGFIEKYKDTLTQDQIDVFNQYIEICKNNRTTDSDILKVADKFKSYNKNNYDMEDLQGFIEEVDPRNNDLDF